MEQEPVTFYEAVCAAYRELAASEPDRIQTIDATRSIEEIEREIWDVISMRFGQLAQMIPSRAAAGIPDPWLSLRKSRSITWRGAQKRSRLAHAYLITGAPGSGKRALAAELAHLVNGAPANEIFAGNAPDVYLASPESKSRGIVIEQIRNLEHALQMRSSDGRRKVAVISDADRMADPAANAFLKTLEEPPNNSLLLLLSSIPESLPETILSRCIEISLASPADTALSTEQAQLLDCSTVSRHSRVVCRRLIGLRRASSDCSVKCGRRSRKKTPQRISGKKPATANDRRRLGWKSVRTTTKP